MSSEQPSLFDQLTPSDSLRDDLAWIDSLQEDTQEDDKPARQERKPRKRRGRKNIPTGYDRRDDAQTDEPTPPVYGQINVYGVTTKSERHKRSYWTRTADGNGIGGRKAPVPYGS